jgi:hypothetical protein
MENILRAMPKTIGVAATVRTQETLYTYTGPEGNVKESKSPINLEAFISLNLLIEVDTESNAEETTFVNFASLIGDDGESITAAICLHRKWAIATDDTSAIKVFTTEAPQLEIISSLDLVKNWATAADCTHAELHKVLTNIRTRAAYIPPKKHPLYSWWQKYMKAE